MTQKNSIRPLTVFAVALSLELAIVPSWRSPVRAIPTSTIPSTTASYTIGSIFDPPGDGVPDNTAGGASRGGCSPQELAKEHQIAPLIPTNNYGLTASARPTFLIYVPKTNAKAAFFTFKDKQEDYYYQTTLPLPSTPGIVSISIPADRPPIEVGKNYTWSFVQICGEKLAVDDPRVGGQIKRVEPDPVLRGQLETAKPLERATLYGAAGMWYDMMASLAEARRSQPNDANIEAVWSELLTSIGLEAIATQPLVE